MYAAEFDKIVASAPKPEDRVTWFGALLSKEGRTEVEIVGGSAIEIYLSSARYISQDVDLVGRKDRITPVLHRWRFQQVEGRSHRVYWIKRPIGLVDIVGAGDRSGLRPRQVETPYGPVLVSAVEPLIVRRLTRAHREKSEELFAQAVELAKQGALDWEYMDAVTSYEGAASLLKKLRKIVQA
ncbi:MAG: hypothetical protein ACREEC_11265 [Thermoplasmata archaeon]